MKIARQIDFRTHYIKKGEKHNDRFYQHIITIKFTTSIRCGYALRTWHSNFNYFWNRCHVQGHPPMLRIGAVKLALTLILIIGLIFLYLFIKGE